MPVTIDSGGKISGSLVFEEFGTDKTKMNFFTSLLNRSNLSVVDDDNLRDDEKLACPQEPLS
jgi:hypothetical protein